MTIEFGQLFTINRDETRTSYDCYDAIADSPANEQSGYDYGQKLLFSAYSITRFECHGYG